MKMKQSKANEPSKQSLEFRDWLLDEGWQVISADIVGGHRFEMFARWGRTLLMQSYPGGHGFEIWTPISASNEIAATKSAITQYGERSKALGEEASR
jgi:hypothetical protein